MKTFKIIIIAWLSTICCLTVQAQQVPMYTHYMNNTLMVNPAYAGSRDALTITALQRMQWIDFAGAPMTNSITMHMPLADTHVGLGLSILNDKIGPSFNTSVVLDYAYMLKLNDYSKLSLGLSAGANIIQTDLSTLQLETPGDPAFANDIKGKVTPDFGVGIYYSREKFYVGFSVPNILQNSYSIVDQNNVSTTIGKERRHYFLIAGSLIDLNEDLAFKPTGLLKYTAAAPIQADVTGSFVIKKRFMVGVMYRTGDAVGGLAGFDITDQLHIGYSYDWSFGLKTSMYNQGSHEFVLRYDFICFDKKRIHSPRNF